MCVQQTRLCQCRSDMMTQSIFLIFLFISCLLPMYSSGTEPTPTYGPFKTLFTSVKDCINPSRPYSKNPPVTFHPYIENVDGKNMLGGNLTVTKDCRDVKMNVKSFFWRNDKWRQARSFNNLDCHDSLLHFTLTAAGVNYNKKDCMLFKGFYAFKKMDVNQLQHIWVPAMPYGRMMWRTESYTKAGMFVCKEFDTLTEPEFNE